MDKLKNYLDIEGRLKVWPSKKKNRVLALEYLADQFKEDVEYSEKEVNEILNKYHTFNDSALLRRALFEFEYFNRTRDCSKYWRAKDESVDREMKGD